MMRLTPDKIRYYGQKLPCNTRRINKGNTSIIYTTDDPTKLEVFTVEWLKMDWWKDELHIIESYDEVATAVYEGYSPRYVDGRYKRVELSVYRCIVDRLEMPSTTDQRRQIRAIRKLVEDARPPFNFQNLKGFSLEDWWTNLYQQDTNEHVKLTARFARDYGANQITPDVGAGDFAILKGQVVILDPFHHDEVHKALQLTKNAPMSRYY